MLLKKLTLNNYANFENAEFNLWDETKPSRKVTIFIGENGAGKSNILDAIATLMSWFVARLRSEKGSGSPINERKIRENTSYSSIELCINSDQKDYIWNLVKLKKGHRTSIESNLKDISEITNIFSTIYTKSNETSSLPLFAYYNAERNLQGYSIKNTPQKQVKPIDGYSENISSGVDFSQFFNWFYDLDNIKNELTSKYLLESFIYLTNDKKIKRDKDGYIKDEDFDVLLNKLKNLQNSEEFSSLIKDKLHFTTEAISTFLPEYKNIRIERLPSIAMLIDKGDVSLDIMQLSQGERSLLALVADIALRLTIMNPEKENPLLGEGIILIDEIDIHLHPRWQRSIVRNLQRTFPNCQFILTTHSPLVVSDPQDVQIFLLENGSAKELDNLYGMDIEQVLLEIMDTPLRHEPLQNKLDDLMDAIQNKDFNKAREVKKELLQILPENHRELMRADLFLKRMEAVDAAHHQK